MSKASSTKPIIIATLRLVIGFPIIGLLFFWPAGTFDYWQAWLWLAILFLPLMVMFAYLIQRDPALLERRVRTSEQRPEQRRIIAASALVRHPMYLSIILILLATPLALGSW